MRTCHSSPINTAAANSYFTSEHLLPLLQSAPASMPGAKRECVRVCAYDLNAKLVVDASLNMDAGGTGSLQQPASGGHRRKCSLCVSAAVSTACSRTRCRVSVLSPGAPLVNRQYRQM